MPYKTISIKLLSPTTAKKTVLNNAIERYSAAFEILLRELSGKIPDGNFSKASFLKLIDKDLFSKASHLNIEPFKDALKLDLAKVISIYIGKKSSGQKTSYPVTRIENTDVEDILNNSELLSQRRVDSSFDKYQRSRPLMFCRFDDKRDYSIIKNDSGSYLVKLYLFNRKSAIDGKRFLLFPLQTAGWQEKFLSDISSGSAIAKSAELIKKNNDYFLNVRLWYEPAESLTFSNYIGISRGVQNELCYAVSNKSGKILSVGNINAAELIGKNKLHSLANEAVKLALDNKCQIVMGNITSRNDGLKIKNLPIYISVGDYNQLINLIGYKAELCGLARPVLVSSSAIFFRCPKCGSFKKVNRFGNDKFICIVCGHSDELEIIGSENLAKMLVTYQKNNIPVQYTIKDKKLIFRLELLDFDFSCPESVNALNQFYDSLQEFLIKNMDGFTKKQLYAAKKILGDKAKTKIDFIGTI